MLEGLKTGLKLRERSAEVMSSLLSASRAALKNAVRDALEDRRVDIEILKHTARTISEGTTRHNSFHLNRSWDQDVLIQFLLIQSGRSVKVTPSQDKETGKHSWEWHLVE